MFMFVWPLLGMFLKREINFKKKIKLSGVSDTSRLCQTQKESKNFGPHLRPNVIPLLFHHGSNVGAHREQILTLYH